MSSKRPPEGVPEGERHELPPDWAPTPSAEDLEALRAARRRAQAPEDRFAVLRAVALFYFPPRRCTSAGWQPFSLPPPHGE